MNHIIENILNRRSVRVYSNEAVKKEDLDLYASGTSPYTHPNVNWIDEILKKQIFEVLSSFNSIFDKINIKSQKVRND